MNNLFSSLDSISTASSIYPLLTTLDSLPSASIAKAEHFLKTNVGNYDASYQYPGLKQTVTQTNFDNTTTNCYSMVPQGFTLTADGKYRLLSAYCGCGKKHKSVIFVINNNTSEYITTLILDNSSHVGGLACSEKYIWVCNSDNPKNYKIMCYKIDHLIAALNKSYARISTVSNNPVTLKPSFMCIYNNLAFIGTFHVFKNVCNIHIYHVIENKLVYNGLFQIDGISKIQGISIRGNYMLLTNSYGKIMPSKAYIFMDSINKFSKPGLVYKKKNAYKIYNIPTMAEGCYIDNEYTYFTFESGSNNYNKPSFWQNARDLMPYDKYVRYRNNVLGMNNLYT